jgi:hypothetical protein
VESAVEIAPLLHAVHGFPTLPNCPQRVHRESTPVFPFLVISRRSSVVGLRILGSGD